MSFRRLLLVLTLLAPALSGARLEAQSEPRVSELLASADEAWKAGQFGDAYARYQAVLRRDSTSARALFRVATLLAWRNDLDHSEALFRVYLRIAPSDDDGRIALARTLAWNGRYAQAMALCDSVLAGNAGQRDASLLAAQVLAWSGSLQGAVGRYRSWLSAHPSDAEAWIALAQVWRWSNRADEAREALRRALTVDPANATARTQLEWATVALTPSFEPTISSTDDSDDNRSTLYTLRGGWAAPWSSRLVVDARYRTADLAARHGSSAAVRATSSWTPLDGQWTIRAELGAARLDAVDAPGAPHVTHVEPIASARLFGRLTPRLSLGGGVTRDVFDETAPLIGAGIATTTLDGDGDLTIRRHWSLGGGAGWTHLAGGSGPNDRVAGSATLRFSPSALVSFGVGGRGFGYQHAAFDGYFAPKHYVLAEVSSRLRFGGELGWGLESEVGLGNQTITAFDNSSTSRFAQRATASVLYRPAPGVEWGVSGGFANVASPTTINSADYRAYTVSIMGRLRL